MSVTSFPWAVNVDMGIGKKAPDAGEEEHTTMGQILERARQRVHDLFVHQAGDADRVESPVCGDHAVEFTVATFLQEVGAVCGGGLDELGDLAEGLPGFVCAMGVSRSG